VHPHRLYAAKLSLVLPLPLFCPVFAEAVVGETLDRLAFPHGPCLCPRGRTTRAAPLFLISGQQICGFLSQPNAIQVVPHTTIIVLDPATVRLNGVDWLATDAMQDGRVLLQGVFDITQTRQPRRLRPTTRARLTLLDVWPDANKNAHGH
jgi:hypothetical protein